MIERRYRMTRVRAGVYLLPSNDGQTLWRISSYDEDGSAHWVNPATNETHAIRGTFWMTARHRKPLNELVSNLIGNDDDWLHSDDWQEWSLMHKTRDAAVRAALEASEVAA